MNNEQRYIASGLAVGSEANHQIADTVVNKATKMLSEALDENFETILQAKLSHAVQETINLHTLKSKQWAKQFLSQSKSRLANNLVETQHNYRLSQIRSNLSLDDLEDFDTDLSNEVARLADEAGSISIEVNPDSAIGF